MLIGNHISVKTVLNSLSHAIQEFLKYIFHTKFNSKFCFWLFIQLDPKLLCYLLNPLFLASLSVLFDVQNAVCECFSDCSPARL